MTLRNGMLAAAAGAGIVLIGAQPLGAQQAPPTQAKDQTVKTVASFDLAPEIPEFTGRYLRARLRTIEPGGHGALHSHRGAPAILYVASGTLTICTPDGKCTDIPEGQAISEGKDATHWATNKGRGQVTYLVVEISKQP